MLSRRILMTSAAAASVVVAAPWVARAQGVVKMRLPGATAESHPAHIGNVELAKALKQKLGNGIEIQIFPQPPIGRRPPASGRRGRRHVRGFPGGHDPHSLVTKKVAFDSYQLPFLIDTYDNFAEART